VTDGGAYAQPTPREFYIHDDLTDEVAADAGPDSPAARLARELIARVAADRVRVRVLTLAEQVERVATQGPHAPFALTLGIGRAGERVARALDARTGWFPHVRRVGLTREEDGAGGYRLVSTDPGGLDAQLDEVSFINASGLVRRTAIRRPGQRPLAFLDRPEWLRAWFPADHAEILALCRRLNALLEPPA
jgi:hypothetical protein